MSKRKSKSDKVSLIIIVIQEKARKTGLRALFPCALMAWFKDLWNS